MNITPEVVDKGYAGLAEAIILQAVEDYKTVYKQHLLNPYNMTTEYELRKLENFFRSDWYFELSQSNLSGDYIIKAIKSEVEKQNVVA